MGRLRRLWHQFRCPMSSYDVATDCYLVPITASACNAMGDWSQPLQVRVVAVRGPNDLQMEVRLWTLEDEVSRWAKL